MKKFKRIRTLKELRAECTRRQWAFGDAQLNAGTSDFVGIRFHVGRTNGTLLISAFNGRFFGSLDSGTEFNSDSARHERKNWFKQLLDFAYTNQ